MTKHIAEPIKSKKDIQAVEKYLKEHNERNYVSVGAKQDVYNLTFDTNSSTAKALGLTPYFSLWSGEENSSDLAYSRGFHTTYSYWSNGYRYYSYFQAVCLGE